MTMMGRASEEGLASVATEVLGPQFHLDSATPKKVRTLFRIALQGYHTDQYSLQFDLPFETIIYSSETM